MSLLYLWQPAGYTGDISPERDRLHLKKQYRQTERRRQKSAPYQIQSWEREIWKQTLRFPLKIPSGITISEVKVESGDHVSSGDVLAEVDSSSVYEAMEEVQEKIEALDEQIADLQEDTDEETISASIDGRVKKIYIGQGEDITSCMLEHGALLVLSADGKMAVDLADPATVPSEEDTVTVTLSSGTQIEGTVEKVSDDGCTITMTDSGVGLGDTATVTDEKGNSIGTGTIYIHQPLQVTGTAGSISEVNVSEDEAVDSGDTLLTLDKDSITASYEALYGQREALAETLTELLNLAKKGTITADMDGTIEEIYVSDEETSDSSSVSAGSGVQLSNMSYTKGTGIQALNMSYTKSYGVQASNMYYTNESVVRIVNVSDTDETAEIFSDDTGSMEEIPSQPEKQTLYLSMADTSAGNAQMLGIVVPRTGGSPQTQIVSSDNSYTGTISWNPGDSTFQPAATYQAAVTLYAGEGYQFAADSVTQAVSGVLSGVSLSSDGSTLSFTITFPETEGSTEEPGDTSGDSGSTEGNQGGSAPSEDAQNNTENSGSIHRRARKMELQTEKVRCRQKLRIIIRERHRIQAVLRGQGVHPPEHRPQMASSQGKRKPRQIQPPSTAQTLQPLRFPAILLCCFR